MPSGIRVPITVRADPHRPWDVRAVVITDARVGGAEHKKFVEAEIAKWGPIIKAAGQYAN